MNAKQYAAIMTVIAENATDREYQILEQAMYRILEASE